MEKDLVFECVACDGTGVFCQALMHTKYCDEEEGCIGNKFCPVIDDIKCDLCIDGQIIFDYRYYRYIWKVTLSDEGERLLTRRDWFIMSKKYIWSMLAEETERMGVFIVPEATKHGHQIILSCLGWNEEYGKRAMIDHAIKSGIPMYAATEIELYHTRNFYGMFEPSGKSKYYEPEIGIKYREWKNQSS